MVVSSEGGGGISRHVAERAAEELKGGAINEFRTENSRA